MKLRYVVFAGTTFVAAGAIAAGDAQKQQSQGAQGQSMSQSTAAQHDSALSADVIRKVQQALNDKGYDAGPVDGNWGPLTKRAVENFQQKQDGLQASGQLDRQTLSALGVEAQVSAATGGSAAASGTGGQQSSQRGQQSSQQEKSGSAAAGGTGGQQSSQPERSGGAAAGASAGGMSQDTETIKQVQQKLNEKGFHAGAVDGKMNSTTSTALRNFQESQAQLKATGQLDQQTLSALGVDAQGKAGAGGSSERQQKRN